MTVSFLDRPVESVLEELVSWKEGLGRSLVVDRHESLVTGIAALDPMEAPWTTELVVDCGDWTAYLNNFVDGGDPTASAARALGPARFVVCHRDSFAEEQRQSRSHAALVARPQRRDAIALRPDARRPLRGRTMALVPVG